jgi:hypothetical protein
VVASSTYGSVGSGGITVTVTLLNADGRPVPGRLVSLSGTGGHVNIAWHNDVTDSFGRAWFTVTDRWAGTTTLTATDVTDRRGLSHRPCVSFSTGPGTATPETPVTVALPVLGAGVLGAMVFFVRRRRSHRTA